MSDTFKGLVVSFHEPVSKAYAQEVAKLIACIGEVAVVTLSVDTMDDVINRDMVRRELGEKLLDVLYPERKK